MNNGFDQNRLLKIETSILAGFSDFDIDNWYRTVINIVSVEKYRYIDNVFLKKQSICELHAL